MRNRHSTVPVARRITAVIMVVGAISGPPAHGEPLAAGGPHVPHLHSHPNAAPTIPFAPDAASAARCAELSESAALIDLDRAGIPRLCESRPVSAAPPEAEPALAAPLPAGSRGWACVPSAVRSDGSESFYVEVDANGPVNQVRIVDFWWFIFDGGGPDPIVMHDDGQSGDRVAGDYVFTAGPFTPNSIWAGAGPYDYYYSPGDPENVNIGYVGRIQITETSTAVSEFLINPVVGILNGSVPTAPIHALAPGVAASPHVINVKTSVRNTQGIMRGAGGSISGLTLPIYAAIPDDADMIMCFSTYKIERLPYLSAANFNAGVHSTVRVNFTGTGRAPFDSSAALGSNGVLMSVSFLDAMERGIWASNAVHEVTHQWSSYLSPALQVTDGSGHYLAQSSAASLVGGFQWDDQGNGTYLVNCNIGRNEQSLAPPIDRYMAGLLPGAGVPPIHVNMAVSVCDPAPRVPQWSTTIAQIQSAHGVRTPGPAASQKDFVIAFVAESVDRMLTPTEMTYYEVFANHFTLPVPEGDPNPVCGQGWKSMTRYWGPGVTWSSAAPRFGDMDRSGTIDALDVPLFVQALLHPATVDPRSLRRADFDRNGAADGRDIPGFLTALHNE